MFDKFNALADEYNVRGVARIVCFALTPIVYGIGWIRGLVESVVAGITEKL